MEVGFGRVGGYGILSRAARGGVGEGERGQGGGGVGSGHGEGGSVRQGEGHRVGVGRRIHAAEDGHAVLAVGAGDACPLLSAVHAEVNVGGVPLGEGCAVGAGAVGGRVGAAVGELLSGLHAGEGGVVAVGTEGSGGSVAAGGAGGSGGAGCAVGSVGGVGAHGLAVGAGEDVAVQRPVAVAVLPLGDADEGGGAGFALSAGVTLGSLGAFGAVVDAHGVVGGECDGVSHGLASADDRVHSGDAFFIAGKGAERFDVAGGRFLPRFEGFDSHLLVADGFPGFVVVIAACQREGGEGGEEEETVCFFHLLCF